MSEIVCGIFVGLDGFGIDGLGLDGIGIDGVDGVDGVGGVGIDGVGIDGVGLDGIGIDGVGIDGVGIDGVGIDVLDIDVLDIDGFGIDGLGIDGLAILFDFTSLCVNNANDLSFNNSPYPKSGVSNIEDKFLYLDNTSSLGWTCDVKYSLLIGLRAFNVYNNSPIIPIIMNSVVPGFIVS